MVKVLILGATGTVGKEVIKSLLDKTIVEQELTIRITSRSKSNAQKILNAIDAVAAPSIEVVEAEMENIQSEEATKEVFEGINRLFILTTSSSKQVDNEKKILRCALKHAGSNLEQVVKISALGADLHNSGPLMRCHVLAEEALGEILKGTKVAYTILRPNPFFQNLFRDAKQIKTTGKFSVPFLDRPRAKISHVDARDIGDVAAKVLSAKDIQQHHNLTYNLGPKAVDYFEIAEIFTKVLGKKVEADLISDVQLFNAYKQFLPLEMVHYYVKLYQYYRAEGTTSVGYGDIEIVTGKPARTIEQFVQDYKELFL